MRHLSISFIIHLFLLSNLVAQNFDNSVVNPRVKTVKLHREGFELSDPIIRLNSDERLVLKFDELTDTPGNYYYRIIHCTSDWRESSISMMEYIEGFDSNPLNNHYQFSSNTLVPYIHYSLNLPNDEIRFKLSGNYLIIVYDDDPENIVLTRRFYVYESIVSVESQITRPLSMPEIQTGHQVDFIIRHPFTSLSDPQSELEVVVYQNTPELSVRDLKPVFIHPGILDFTFHSKNYFPAYNEFRYFDTKTTRYETFNVYRIELINGVNHMFLVASENRGKTKYISYRDIDGRFYVDTDWGNEKDIMADYVYVHFTLPAEVPYTNSVPYIYGELTDWQIKPQGAMAYNKNVRAYQAVLFLKQGYYNYWYTLVKDGTTTPDIKYFEGSHWEAGNRYGFLVYYHPFSSRYDRLVGYNVADFNIK